MTNEQKLALDLVLSVVSVGPGSALPLRGIIQRLDGRCLSGRRSRVLSSPVRG
jgi:hypothetical protein